MISSISPSVGSLGIWCCLAESNKDLHGLAAKTLAVIRFKPVERCVRFRIQSELGAVLNEVSALFRILHQAAGFHFIRPRFDFSRRLFRAVGLQPSADIFIIFRGLNGGFELAAINALETEEHVVQRTIIMIFAECTCEAGAAFVNSAAGYRESGDTFARAVRGLFGQVVGDNGCVHDFIIFRVWFVWWKLYFYFVARK
jgi:hypothetical protein